MMGFTNDDVTYFTEEDWRKVFDASENFYPPPARVREAAQKYRELIEARKKENKYDVG